MKKSKLIALLGNTLQYYQKVQKIFGSSLIRYYPLYDAAGSTVAKELITSETNTPANITFGATGVGDGKTSISCNGTSSNIAVKTAAFVSAFNLAEGTLFGWIKMSAADIWSDTSIRTPILFADAHMTHIFNVYSAGNNTLMLGAPGVLLTLAGGTGGARYANWFFVAVTWSRSNSRTLGYFNGLLTASGGIPTDPTGEDIFEASIGSSRGSERFHSGNLAHVGILNREATAAEIWKLFSTLKSTLKFGIIGDSISAGAENGLYVNMLIDQHPNAPCSINNHAVSGHTIISSMDAQVVAAATDGSNIIILALGTNDNNAGDMNALQAEIEENIIELKASNPSATIYYMNVLKRWADAGVGAEVDKSNIRTAIAAACTAQGITCWDTYTTSWIAQNETADGLHPNLAGHQKIATAILARLP